MSIGSASPTIPAAAAPAPPAPQYPPVQYPPPPQYPPPQYPPPQYPPAQYPPAQYPPPGGYPPGGSLPPQPPAPKMPRGRLYAVIGAIVAVAAIVAAVLFFGPLGNHGNGAAPKGTPTSQAPSGNPGSSAPAAQTAAQKFQAWAKTGSGQLNAVEADLKSWKSAADSGNGTAALSAVRSLVTDSNAAAANPPPIGRSDYYISMEYYNAAGNYVLAGDAAHARTDLRKANNYMSKVLDDWKAAGVAH